MIQQARFALFVYMCVMSLPLFAQEVEKKTDVKKQPQVAYGYLTLTTLPEGGSVLIDGNLVGKTPLIDHPLTEGEHSVELYLENYYPVKIDLTIVKEERKDFTFNFKPKSTETEPIEQKKMGYPYRTWGWVSLGTGGALAVVGLVLYIVARTKVNAANDLYRGKTAEQITPDIESQHDSYMSKAKTFRAASISLACIGAVGIGIGIWLVLWKKEIKSESARIIPQIMPYPLKDGGGLGLSWDF